MNTTGKGNPDNAVDGSEILTQISTIDAVVAGIYDGVVDFDTLCEYGDFGIGTFEGLDGEMIGFDGEFYQVRSDGVGYPVSGSMKTPFASVTFFEADSSKQLPADMNYEELRAFLDNCLPMKNMFHAIRIDGKFDYMKTRSVPAQEKPYPPLVEVTEEQPTFEFNNVRGTIAGFRFPDYAAGVNMPGYHLHFINDAEDSGGHVLDFRIEEARASIDCTREFYMILPDDDSDFYDVDFSKDRSDEMEKAEK
ncbi:MAG: acetolactate decarboxylase [Dehalococcoidales bacterium]